MRTHLVLSHRPLAWWFLLLAFLVLVAATARAELPNRLSLAEVFQRQPLSQTLLPLERWQPFPTMDDRAAWQTLPGSVSTQLLALGEKSLARPIPPLPATLYLEFARSGNRSHYEAPFFERRGRLQNLVLAECVEGKGRFLDAISDTLWAICEESSWCLPAHVGAQKAKAGLPDIEDPIVDLFAGETGVVVAWTLYLAGPKLDQISPLLTRRALAELERRILAPVAARDDFGWMALNVTSPDRRPNNWTPWISASVLTSALLCEKDAARRILIVQKLLRSLDGFLKFHPADGSCDEGPSYWGRAGGSLLDCLDILHSASDGKLTVYDEPLVQEMGRFIYRAYIAGDYFVPIGDCPARFLPEHDLVFRYGKRITDPQLQAFGASGATVESLLSDRFLGRQLYAVFDAAEILNRSATAPPLLRDVWLPSEDLQLMTARSQAGSNEGFYVAAWGGHNAQSHNHNDVGNFLVFADGQPVFVDLGAPTYTAQTFSSRRYEIWAFQSSYHNLPAINGTMQSAGRSFAARSVTCVTNEGAAQLRMDLAAAYPAAASVKSWFRTVRLHRNLHVEISEDFELSGLNGVTALNLLTPLEVTCAPGHVVLRTPESSKHPVNLKLEFDGAKLAASVERIDLSDARLVHSWGSHLNRLVLKPAVPSIRDVWKYTLARH